MPVETADKMQRFNGIIMFWWDEYLKDREEGEKEKERKKEKRETGLLMAAFPIE